MLIRAFFYFICTVMALIAVAIITFFVGYMIFYRKKLKRLRAMRKSKYNTKP